MTAFAGFLTGTVLGLCISIVALLHQLRQRTLRLREARHQRHQLACEVLELHKFIAVIGVETFGEQR